MNKKMRKSNIIKRRMNKKGQGISINTIIIVAIALLVLIILAILIARSGQDASKGTKCISKGGVCQPSGECTGTVITAECSNIGYSCCRPV